MIMKLCSKIDGKKYDCFAQSVDLNMNGRWVLRYAIGIMGREGHLFILRECIYNNDDFNRKYEVISAE